MFMVFSLIFHQNDQLNEIERNKSYFSEFDLKKLKWRLPSHFISFKNIIIQIKNAVKL